ncbi:MAG: cupin domain-containing protein [Phycisphaeraceae bacterium]
MARPLFEPDTVGEGNLAELSRVVKGAIVSKPLIDTGPLKQILFSMDAGQEISEHKAPFPATVQILVGRVRLTVEEKSYELGPNDWLFMPPNAPHDLLTVDEPVQFLLTLVKA